MIHLPILTRLEVRNYLLYPGSSGEHSISFDFSNGITLIAGTNGLGKTTLINILYRCIVGPFNPPKDDGGMLSARQQETIWRDRRSYFSKRVGDQAATATARLQFKIGETSFDVTRRLSDVRLTKLLIDEQEISVREGNISPEKDDAEKAFKSAFQRAIGASSFVAALQMVRQLVFFDETRRALLWDTQSQAAMLRDLLIGASDAGRLREIESRYMSADSKERNLRWQVNSLNLTLGNMRTAAANAGPVSDELASIMSKLRADQERHPILQQRSDDAEQDVRRLRLQVERARLMREEARRAVEEQRLLRAERLFRHLPDTGRYILSRFYSGSECLACGADVAEKLARIEDLITHGDCLVCDSPPDKQRVGRGTAPTQEQPQTDDEFQDLKDKLGAITSELEGLESALREAEELLANLTKELAGLTLELENARRRAKTLSAALPPDSTTISQRERERESMVTLLNRAAQERRETAEVMRSLLTQVKEAAQAQKAAIVEAFSRYAGDFLAEDAALSFAPRQAKLGQSEKFELPRFQLDMSSAAYSERVPRFDADDVSESQREFIDLAYRMALIDTSVEGAACLIMETPEASLDGVFMEQAGKMLNSYGARPDRQMVVTSNLSNAGMISALMEGQRQDDRGNVINLFEEAAPTRAVERFRSEYEQLLLAALDGE